ncbi:hypothetical protein HOLleu_39073 [Holothuria leucospilota]|uniref:IgGFc-binding protein N-terminal domain-containing protein n=1 Tax=Holothuria leucospilota TaxID=206669 RepID=A0A9Q0YJT3_HOLLE|nr:hypothetical protein HOLleu_39073 [Holothuria leucospilota]
MKQIYTSLQKSFATGAPVKFFSVLLYFYLLPAFEGLTEQYIFSFLTVNCGVGTTTEIFIGTKFFDVGAFGYISFPLLSIQHMTFDLQPGSGKIFSLSPDVDSSEDKLNQTLHTAVAISANEEVVVYGHQRCISGSFRGSAFSVKGIKDLGTDYWVITHQSKGVSQVGIVSTANNTNVVINGMYFNKILNLNKYETFYLGGYYDLTGTHITSNKPVLVLAGNSADTTPNSGTGYEDSFYECFPPVRDWERYFSLVPFPKSNLPFTVKILSVHDRCNIQFDDNSGNLTEVSLGKGKNLDLQSIGNLTINSSEVILVAQFSQGEYGNAEGGNPSMLLTPPYESATRNEFIFPVFGFFEVGRNERNYIDIWLPPGGQTSDILLDNETVAWQKIGENINGYTIVRSTLTSYGLHTLQSDTNITAVVYGFGDFRFHAYSLS